MKSPIYIAEQKTVETLYDLYWAITHDYIDHEYMFNERTTEEDLVDCAYLLECMYWILEKNEGKSVKFRIETVEED